MTYDESEQEPITEFDTENATRLNPSEGNAPENDPELWNRLSNINTGVVDSFGNADKNTSRQQERLAAWDVLSGQLELNDWQKRRGRDVFADLDLEALGTERHLVAFCLAVFVIRGDSRSRREYHPRRPEGRNDDCFLSVESDHDFGVNRVHSVLNRLANRLGDKGVEI